MDLSTLESDLLDPGLPTSERRALILYVQHLDFRKVPQHHRPLLAESLQAGALGLDPTHDERYIWTALRCIGELAGERLDLFLPFLDSSRLTVRHVTLQILEHLFEHHPHVLSSPMVPELRVHVVRLLRQHLDEHDHENRALHGDLVKVAEVLGLYVTDPV